MRVFFLTYPDGTTVHFRRGLGPLLGGDDDDASDDDDATDDDDDDDDSGGPGDDDDLGFDDDDSALPLPGGGGCCGSDDGWGSATSAFPFVLIAMPSCAGGDGSVRVPAVTDPNRTRSHVEAFWDDQIVPTLIDYVRIPNKSPSFDPDWEANGHMNDVLELALAWLERNPVPGSTVHVGRAPGRTPLILVDCPGTGEGDTVLMYGHLDKQPEMEGWLEGLGPWIPKIIDDKLYGRGAADDGYALFASVAALRALHDVPPVDGVVERRRRPAQLDPPARSGHNPALPRE